MVEHNQPMSGHSTKSSDSVLKRDRKTMCPQELANSLNALLSLG